jgi:prophage antirepressor-like protein
MAIKNNSIQSFAFTENIRVRSLLDEHNSPWFVAADVCRALQIRNTRDAITRLDDDEKTTVANADGRAGFGAQEFNIINESGLYSLILTSRKAEAKQFKKWVTNVVLPSIRQTGQYSVNQALNLPDQSEGDFYIVKRRNGFTVFERAFTPENINLSLSECLPDYGLVARQAVRDLVGLTSVNLMGVCTALLDHKKIYGLDC